MKKNKLSFKFQTLFSIIAFCVGIIGIAVWTWLAWDSVWKWAVVALAALITVGLFVKIFTMPVSFFYSSENLQVNYLILPKRTYKWSQLEAWKLHQIKTFNDTYKIVELQFGKKIGVSKQEYHSFDGFLKFVERRFSSLKIASQKKES